MINPNREIYNRCYSSKNLVLQPVTRYDQRMIRLRQQYIEQYGYGRDVLDLCCGSGSYLIPVLPKVKTAIGIDFSSNMLNEFHKALGNSTPPNLTLLEEDVTSLSLPNECVDFIFSYTALYYVPRLDLTLREACRVLRKGGYAVFELGNSTSLNMFVSNTFYKDRGWAKLFCVPYSSLREYVTGAGFDIVEWRVFQFLNNYGVPLRLIWLYPLASPLWKKILGLEVTGKMLDEWISSMWPLRYFAFRHIVVARKK